MNNKEYIEQLTQLSKTVGDQLDELNKHQKLFLFIAVMLTVDVVLGLFHLLTKYL